mmetsp:Transcript_11612/g.29385  ORF Transcript_11612/g.29385 Transcript_11612/m.29385 type:complete len:242 (+) Transcript_11612:228-953(+)
MGISTLFLGFRRQVCVGRGPARVPAILSAVAAGASGAQHPLRGLLSGHLRETACAWTNNALVTQSVGIMLYSTQSSQARPSSAEDRESKMPKRPAFANAQAMTRTLKVPDLVSPEVNQAPQACGRHQAVIPPPDLSLSVAHCRAIPRTTRAATAIILVHSHRMAGTISAGTCGTFVPSIPCDSMHSSLILLPGLDDLRKGHLGVIAHYSTDAGWCEEHVCIGHVPTQYYGLQHSDVQGGRN